jgi:hypothetical protein
MKRYKTPGSDQIPAELIQADLEQRRIASPVERVNCCTYSQKG